jgi:hypothetical protein
MAGVEEIAASLTGTRSAQMRRLREPPLMKPRAALIRRLCVPPRPRLRLRLPPVNIDNRRLTIPTSSSSFGLVRRRCCGRR